MKGIKETIRLLQKKLANGNISLYLDIYRNGKREYEFLKMYLIPERSKTDKETNRQTLQLANSIKSKRIVAMQNGEYDFNDRYNTEVLFYDYYRAMCAKRRGNEESRGNWGNWYSCLRHMLKYEPNERITFAQITPESEQGFKD